MGWKKQGCFLFVRTLSFLASHATWVLALMTRCAYFQLWKSYDIFWLWIYIIATCAIPRLRYDNILLQCSFLWRRTCADGERWRYALTEQDTRVDEEDEKSSKIMNAVDTGVTILRFRTSAAMLLGNIHIRWLLPRSLWRPEWYIMGWTAFQFSVWIDLFLFWSMLLFMWCRQCWLCCRLGCWRYYVWCILVVIVGAVLMEVPMYYAFQRLDRTWCNLTWDKDDQDRDEGSFERSTLLPAVHAKISN